MLFFKKYLFYNKHIKAKVVAIYKGKKSKEGRGKPIDLLPVLTNVFEKLIKWKIINFLKTTNGLDKRQFGF